MEDNFKKIRKSIPLAIVIIAIIVIIVVMFFSIKLIGTTAKKQGDNKEENVQSNLDSMLSDEIQEMYQDFLLYKDGRYKDIKGLKTIEEINNQDFVNYGKVSFITNNKDIKDMDISGNTMLFLESSGRTYRTDSITEMTQIIKEEEVTHGMKITAVSTDGFGTLYIDENGKLYAAGSNRYGQFGTSEKKYDKLVCLSDICIELRDKIIVKAQMGESATVLDSEGNIYTSGRNTYGQLGNGTKEDSTRWNHLNTLSNDLTQKVVKDFESSNFGLIILDNEGKIYTCGSPEVTGVNQENQLVPTCISNNGTLAIHQKYILDIALQNKDVAVVDLDGVVYAWGENNINKIVYNYTDSGNGRAFGATRVVQIEQANGVTFVITSEGEVFEWGANGIVKDKTTQMVARSLTNYAGSSLKGKKVKKIVTDESNALLLDESGKIHYYGNGVPKNLSDLKLNYNGERVSKLTNLFNFNLNKELIKNTNLLKIDNEEKITQCYRLTINSKKGIIVNKDGKAYVVDTEVAERSELTSNVKQITESLLITNADEIYVPNIIEQNVVLERIEIDKYNNEKVQYISKNFIITENQNVYQVYRDENQMIVVKKVFETESKIKKFQPGKYKDNQNSALVLLEDGTVNRMDLNGSSPIIFKDTRKIVDLFSNGNTVIVQYEDKTYFTVYLADYLQLPEY